MTQQTILSNLGIITIHNCRSDQIGGTAIFFCSSELLCINFTCTRNEHKYTFATKNLKTPIKVRKVYRLPQIHLQWQPESLIINEEFSKHHLILADFTNNMNNC